jgi:hypothetical protein
MQKRVQFTSSLKKNKKINKKIKKIKLNKNIKKLEIIIKV